ncbi:hypothetical protein GCM10010528_01040 [Gordonia defluvii]|jgi:hypothetical protein|uniref:MspA protein n=1 Tax=Gordonia defluvii TaxID=283718 RepID=A0ABN3Y8E2_9ACTN|nr:MspA family porin [Gordonia sp. UBA5067]
MSNPLRVTAAAAVVVAAMAGATGIVPARAAADIPVALPGEAKTLRMGDGTVLTLKRTAERALINPSLGGTPLHRNVWVSGRYQITASRKVKQMKVRPGYIVGCQVNFAGADSSGDEGDADAIGGGIEALGAGEAVHLGPGQAAFFNLTDAERKDDFSSERHEPYYRLKNTDHARYRYVNAQLGLTGCAGYAQARSWLRLSVETEFATQILDFFGRPFSIG